MKGSRQVQHNRLLIWGRVRERVRVQNPEAPGPRERVPNGKAAALSRRRFSQHPQRRE